MRARFLQRARASSGQRRRPLLAMSGVLGFLLVTSASAQEVSVSKSSNTIYATVSASLTGTECCVSLGLDNPGVPGNSACTQSCPSATFPFSWTCNSVGTHTVTGCMLGSETNYEYVCTDQTIEILDTERAQPSPTCPLFDLLAGQKVLTHLFDPNDTYPVGQVKDAEMPITIRARRADPGTTIYLQVSDPPDTSLYGTPHSANDNYDVSTTNVGTIGGQSQITMQLPASGQTTSLVLTTTPFAAGDNYRIVGSIDPQLLTNPAFQCTDCPDSGIITAWKRVYLESDRMFRKGAMLTASVSAGATEIDVSSVSGFVAPKGKSPGSSIVLVHAPTQPGGPIYYEPAPGDPPLTVSSVNKNKLTIKLSRPLIHGYFKAPDPAQPWLADGVGVVTGVMNTDTYSSNTSLLSSLFAQAFVEVIPRSSDPGYVPYYANFLDPSLQDILSDGLRWFRNYGKPNYICSIGGANSGTNLGDRLINNRVAWTWVAKVESLVSSGNRANLNGESTSHEMTHVWDVNQLFNNMGHCDQFDYGNPSLLCLMRPGNDWSDSTGTVLPQFYDGRVMYHYNIQALDPSEFLNIRTHAEPLQ